MAAPSPLQSAAPAVTRLQVRWDTSPEPIAVVEVTKGESLLVLYSKLVKLIPALKKTWFGFLYQGVPIRSELWELIEARKFEPVVVIKEGFYDFVKRTQVGSIGLALYDFHMEPKEEAKEFVTLSFHQGDTVVVLKHEKESAWWYGCMTDRMQYGWFPSNRVHLVKNGQENEATTPSSAGQGEKMLRHESSSGESPSIRRSGANGGLVRGETSDSYALDAVQE
eukprot:TRINITY_DN77846_c0_g1_i1.p1 TRINITY_DN77846_c0_g1~~TRINITY_DN77846_c0_g1_i1.p1  ORF type:complete len:223 (-),score=44.16 TRINITY_DN77846_c0_g1_i1:28-696(-)